MEYADYQHAMAQHAAALSHNNQLHPAMAQIPMLSAAGLNLTVMSGLQANNAGGQHHLGQVSQAGHHVMYQNVQSPGGGGGGGGGHHHQQPVHHPPAGRGHGSKKNKKPKVNKDGVPAPKRATTAYINFTQWYREELKKSGRPIPKIGDFGKECAGKWNSMQEEEKQPFLDVANRDRERYKKEMQVYKPARDANKPKRPGTAFMLFMGDFRKEMAGKEPEGGVAALAKLGGERWRNMTDESKRPYVEKQNEEKVRYEAAMEDYRRKTPQSVPPPKVKSAGMTAPPPKQARLSTEGSEIGSAGESDSGGPSNSGDHTRGNTPSGQDGGQNDQHQAQNMVIRQQNASTPSPASSSSPQQQTLSPSPQGQQGQGSQHQAQGSQHQAQTTHAALAMAGYAQHTFAANFGHPGAAGVLANAAAAANYNQAHSAAMSGSGAPSYLPTGAGTNYPPQPYSWN